MQPLSDVDEAEVLVIAERLYGPALALCGPGPDAEDLVHDTIESLIVRWNTVTGSRLAYARSIMANKFADELRHMYRDRAATASLKEDRTVNSGEDSTLNIARDADLNKSLMTLPERTRAIVVMRYLFGYSANETGTLVGLPASSVRRIAHSALGHLQHVYSNNKIGD